MMEHITISRVWGLRRYNINDEVIRDVSVEGNNIRILFDEGEKSFAFPISFVGNKYMKAEIDDVQNKLEELVLKAEKDLEEHKKQRYEEKAVRYDITIALLCCDKIYR